LDYAIDGDRMIHVAYSFSSYGFIFPVHPMQLPDYRYEKWIIIDKLTRPKEIMDTLYKSS
jgi:hypothetical protein